MLKNNEIILPPWLAFPEIPRYSIGWRMGAGENHIMEWGAWLSKLSSEEKAEYQKLFPEAITWKGYWEEKDDCLYYEKGEFFIQFWREKGYPKYSIEKIEKQLLKGEKTKFTMFWGHQPSADGKIIKSCFSQWWKSDFYDDIQKYCCMEQFMMAKKAEIFEDKEVLEQILASNDPKAIKELGRKVKNFDDKTWNEVKYSIVLNGNYLKFSQNSDLKKFLLSTGDSIIVEASPYDKIWGIGMKEDNDNSKNPLKWKGENLLGFALMEVRDELGKICENEEMGLKVEC